MNEVKRPKKPLIYYYSIVVLILLLFNFLAMPWIAQKAGAGSRLRHLYGYGGKP